jgi:lysine 2,3-aminomutase
MTHLNPGDWKSQLKHRIRSLDELSSKVFPNMVVTESMREAEKLFPLSVTPYYASLVKKQDFSDPVFAQIVPRAEELIMPRWLMEDPLEEEDNMPVPRLVHRYPDRALIIATSMCSSKCRHCTRKRVLSSQCESHITSAELEACIGYLHDNQEIDDVLVSGGDPLTLDDAFISRILSSLRTVKSVRSIRLATRTLVNMPMRITEELVAVISRHKPVFVNTHFNHPDELTSEAIKAADMLTDAGIPVANQAVLLRGINDSPDIIEKLCRTLYHSRIRPYYLFQCDLVRGIEHLRTPLDTGLEIMHHLRGRLSGMAIPNFAVDTPGNGGKIEILPQSIISRTRYTTVLVNSHGHKVEYPEPQENDRSP